MQVQATPTSNQTTVPKEFSKPQEQQGDAGAFDAAVSALLSAIHNGRQQTFQQTFEHSSHNIRNQENHAPVPEKSFDQAEHLNRRVMRMVADATYRETAVRDAGSVDSSGGKEAHGVKPDQATGAGNSANNTGVNGNANSAGSMNSQAGPIAVEATPAVEKPAGVVPDAAVKAVVLTEEQVPKAQPQEQQRHNEQTGRRLDVLMEQILVRNASGEVKTQAPAQTAVPAEPTDAAKANNTYNNVRMVVELEQTAKMGQGADPAPDPAKAAVAANMLNQEKTAAVQNAETNQAKPAADNAVKVVVDGPQTQQQQSQQQSQLSQQTRQEQPDLKPGNKENATIQFKPADPVAAEAAKSGQVIPDKAEPATISIPGNQIPPGGQQAAPGTNEPVTLPGLRDRMVQEVRHIFQSQGSSKQQAQVHLKLHPAHLGELTVRLFFNKGGEITAHFYAASNNVKEALESSMQQLKTALQGQDLKLSETQVFVSDFERQQQDNQGANTEAGSRQVASKYHGNRDNNEETEATEASPMKPADDSSDYQVNYYV